MTLNHKIQKGINRLTFGLSTMGPGFGLKDIGYNFRQSFYSLKRLFKVVWNFRGYDYQGTLDILSVCLKMHLEKLRESSSLQEIDETRIPKEKKN